MPRIFETDFGITNLGPAGDATLTYTVYDTDGTAVVNDNAGIVEIGSTGHYQVSLSGYDNVSGSIVWNDSNTGYEASEGFGPISATNADMQALLGRITDTLFSGITSLAAWLGIIAGKASDPTTLTEVQATTAGAGYDNTTDSLEAQADAGGGGTGARTVTLTINDGTNALQNATVRMTEGANTYTATTNVSGVATFSLDDATYSVAITKAGYSFTPTTLAISADTSHTYSMTAISITPATGNQTNAYLTTFDAQGAVKANVTITFTLQIAPSGTGESYDAEPITATSNGSGLLNVALRKSARYVGKRGDGVEYSFVTGTGTTYAIPNALGLDS